MSLLCDLQTLKTALEECVSLLTKENLSCRKVDEETFTCKPLIELKDFLSWLSDKIGGEVNTYEKLIEEIQSSETDKKYESQVGFLGKILDAVQIVKPSTTRNQQVVNAIKRALERTGHHFLWQEVSEEERNKYAQELVSATATFHLLEVVLSAPTHLKGGNPIATLRRSMGDRLAEEYFAELLAGWFVEDVVKSTLESKNFSTELTGVDKERKVLFVRPENMGDYDLKVCADGGSFLLEVQRVGRLRRVSTDAATKQGDSGGKCVKGYFRTALKSHKYEGGDEKDKFLVLWIGKDAPHIAKTHKHLFNNKMIFIPYVRSHEKVAFKNDTIFFDEKILDSSAVSWDKFKTKDKEWLRDFFKKCAM